MPPIEQRYTPVPGFGRPSTSSGYSGHDNAAQRGGTVNQAAYSDPFRNTASYPSPAIYPRSDSNFSAETLPAAPATMSNTPLGMTQSPFAEPTSYKSAYQNIPSTAYYPEAEVSGADAFQRSAELTQQRKRKRLGIIAGVVIGAVIIIAVVVGVAVSQTHKKSNGSVSQDDSSKNSGSSSGSNGTLSNPNDPSDFQKDPALHQVFWGIAYEPEGVQPPSCGGVQANVTRDIQLLSQLTQRLHLYGANCNETALVLQAIQDTKVNMSVWLAIYVNSDETAYTEQVTAVQDALTTYGVDNIAGISMGNEYILDTAGSDSNTSAAYLAAVSDITTKVASFKATLQSMNLGKTIPVGTSDAGSILSTTLADGIDFYMANVHPYFGALPIDQAAAWTNTFFNEFDVSVAATAPNKPQAYIGETGWPTGSLNASDAQDGSGSPQGDASVANLQTFLDTFVCQANANGTEYFYFEAFDEPWKAIYGGVEPYWGLFDSNRNLKNITIPQC